MAAANTDKFIKVAPNTGWQLGASGISDAAVTNFALVSASGLPTDTAVLLSVDRLDSNNQKTPAKMERIIGVVSGSNIINCVRGVEGTAQAHAGGAKVEILISATNINNLMAAILVEHNQDGTHKDISGPGKIELTEQADTPATPATGKSLLYFKEDGKLYKKNDAGSESEVGVSFANFNAPEGFLINGKIVPSVNSGNLTVALKTTAGTDPSVSNTVHIMLGGSLRTITSALSVTKNAGTNWAKAGSAELATREIDWFVSLSWGDKGAGFVSFIAITRIPEALNAVSYNDTNEKTALLDGNLFTPLSEFSVTIGRFSATLSAGPSYTWSVPTFTALNLIQRPIYKTRDLIYLPVFTGFSSSPVLSIRYKLINSKVSFYAGITTSGTSNATNFTMTLPFAMNSSLAGSNGLKSACFVLNNGSYAYTPGRIVLRVNSSTADIHFPSDVGEFTASGAKGVEIPTMSYEI